MAVNDTADKGKGAGTDSAPGLNIEQSRGKGSDVETDTKREQKLWEKDDAPKGSTEGSLLHYDENGNPDRVSGPTHYAHLANGKIVGGYGIGTHHTDADVNNGAPVPITAHYSG